MKKDLVLKWKRLAIWRTRSSMKNRYHAISRFYGWKNAKCQTPSQPTCIIFEWHVINTDCIEHGNVSVFCSCWNAQKIIKLNIRITLIEWRVSIWVIALKVYSTIFDILMFYVKTVTLFLEMKQQRSNVNTVLKILFIIIIITKLKVLTRAEGSLFLGDFI